MIQFCIDKSNNYNVLLDLNISSENGSVISYYRNMSEGLYHYISAFGYNSSGRTIRIVDCNRASYVPRTSDQDYESIAMSTMAIVY